MVTSHKLAKFSIQKKTAVTLNFENEAALFLKTGAIFFHSLDMKFKVSVNLF